MSEFLSFKEANCKNCYKCLRECPVKAIVVNDDHARIISDLCVLCGHCANVCRFEAKKIADSIPAFNKLISGGKPVIASLAPAFVGSFNTLSFNHFKDALLKLGFTAVEETARGAKSVTAKYKELLDSKQHKNLIASACPSIVRLVQLYYPKALPYLAMADSPMVAHAKLIKQTYGSDCKIVFIGPCIAKKREAEECGLVDCALTFEELEDLFSQNGICINPMPLPDDGGEYLNRARYYPINRGIIKSFEGFSDGYEYICVDGLARAKEVLENIDTLTGMFIEMHACEFSCINGPAALRSRKGGYIKGTETVRAYAKAQTGKVCPAEEVNLTHIYPRLKDTRKIPPEYEIRRILEATGKYTTQDELNCGACGYATCRDKAVAVYNGFAETKMCVPYMRERAESMSYDIIQNSPNGILAVDADFKIVEINAKAVSLLKIDTSSPKGELLEKFYNPTDFYLAMLENTMMDRKKLFIDKSSSWVEMTIRKVANQNLLFCIMKDITQDKTYEEKISKLKEETLSTTNDVIEKQMRVVQEIASLLGETAAETKIALVKLKNTLIKDGEGKDA